MSLDLEERGLHVLYPAEGEKSLAIHADLVFLHGVNGSPTRTWKHEENGSFWPWDFLTQDMPLRIPSVRIMTLGYGAKAGLFSNSYASFREYAAELLGKMIDVRQSREEERRPIIWICHSLGGIVVKQALVQAKLQERYDAIQKSTIGIIFFATPHRGTKVAKHFGRLSSVVNPLLHSPEAKLLEHLRSNSSELSNLSEDARHVLPGVQILNFVEMKPIKGMKELIVSAHSARLNLENEEVIPVESDHRNICRFASRNDSTYHTVLRKIKTTIDNARIVVVAKETRQYQQVLAEIAEQINNIKSTMQAEAANLIESLDWAPLGPAGKEDAPISPHRTQESAVLAASLVSDAKRVASEIQRIIVEKKGLEAELRTLRREYESIVKAQSETVNTVNGLQRENDEVRNARKQSDKLYSASEYERSAFLRESNESERLLGIISDASQNSSVVDNTVREMTALVRGELDFLHNWVHEIFAAGPNPDRSFWVDFMGNFIPFVRSFPGDLEPTVSRILDSYQSQERERRHQSEPNPVHIRRTREPSPRPMQTNGALEMRFGPLNLGTLNWTRGS